MFVQRGRRSADPWGLLLPCQAAAGKRYRRSFLRPRDLEDNATGPTDGASRWPVPAAIDGTAIEVDRMVNAVGLAGRSSGQRRLPTRRAADHAPHGRHPDSGEVSRGVQGLALSRPHGPEV